MQLHGEAAWLPHPAPIPPQKPPPPLITPWKRPPRNYCMCTLIWQLLSPIRSLTPLPSSLFALPPPPKKSISPASCSSLEGLSWSEPIKHQWVAARRKHGCFLRLYWALIARSPCAQTVERGRSAPPTGLQNLWPHVGHSQTHKIA